MAQLNDCMFTALVVHVGTQKTINDMLYDYLLQNGATAGNLNDLWNQVWDNAAIPSGNFNDRAYEWLGTLGHTQDQLNERWLDFWCSGGNIVLVPNLVKNSRLCDELGNSIPDEWTANAASIEIFNRGSFNTTWYLHTTGIGAAELIEVPILPPDSYVASFRVERKWSGTDNYKVGIISGADVTINQDFPLINDVAPPTWVNCFFTVGGAGGSVTFNIRTESTGVEKERMVVSRPQIITGTSFQAAELTGVQCTGTPIQMVLDSTGEPLVDINGEYLYVGF